MQKKWTDIGLDMFQKSNGAWFRKPKTIRERWTSHVNPLVNKYFSFHLVDLDGILRKISFCLPKLGNGGRNGQESLSSWFLAQSIQ